MSSPAALAATLSDVTEAEYVRFTASGEVPAWTGSPQRVLDHFWHPGHPNLFAYSLVHSPASFSLHGILIEEGSLVSV